MEGWIKLHRKLLDWEWVSEPNVLVLFIHLLLMANHKDKRWKGIVVKRGEIVTSLKSLSEKTGLTIQQVRTALNKLKNTNEITKKSTNKFTLLTIVNYEKYQMVEETVTNKQQTNNNQITTNKNEKNIINNNIYTQPQEVEGGISEEKPEEEPKEKPKEESKKEPKEPKPKKPRIKYDEKFEAMWNGYRSNAVETPAGSKKQAYEVYKKLLKYYDAETILAHARYYLKDCIKTKTKTKHLVNFLKKEDFDTPVEELYESARDDKKKKKIDIKVLG